MFLLYGQLLISSSDSVMATSIKSGLGERSSKVSFICCNYFYTNALQLNRLGLSRIIDKQSWTRKF